MSVIYGGPVSRNKAREHFRDFIAIKRESVDLIKDALTGNDRATRYYCGRDQFVPTHQDLAFIFDKVAIQNLLTKLNNGQADGIAIFHGVREIGDFPESANDVDGRPTVMLFPYTYQNPANKEESSLVLGLDDGTEHPGTGGKGGGPGGREIPDDELPSVFHPGNIQPAPPRN